MTDTENVFFPYLMYILLVLKKIKCLPRSIFLNCIISPDFLNQFFWTALSPLIFLPNSANLLFLFLIIVHDCFVFPVFSFLLTHEPSLESVQISSLNPATNRLTKCLKEEKEKWDGYSLLTVAKMEKLSLRTHTSPVLPPQETSFFFFFFVFLFDSLSSHFQRFCRKFTTRQNFK